MRGIRTIGGDCSPPGTGPVFSRAGVVIKGIDGVLETLGGATLLFVGPSEVNRLFALLTQHELSEDPHDFFATHAAAPLARVTPGSLSFGAKYLIAHGAVKIFLAVNLLQRRLWAYPVAIVFLSLFIIYQLYRYSFSHSIGLLILGALDAAVVLLIWNEYRYLNSESYGPAA